MSKADPKIKQSDNKSKNSRKGKKGIFTPLLDFDLNILLPGRHPCDCESSSHKLINNCLSCGRIVCEQEGVGECFTCGELVNDKETEKANQLAAAAAQEKENEKKKKNDERAKRGGIKNIAASLEKAVQHKNKLLDYDRNCAQRTKVIDDESDYFRLTSQHWISQEKRDKIEAKLGYLQENKFAKERKLALDIDKRSFVEEITPVIADVNKIVEEMEEDAAFHSDYTIVDSKSVNWKEKLPGVKYYEIETKDKEKKEQKGRHHDKDRKEKSPSTSSTLTPKMIDHFSRNSLRLQDPELMEMSDAGVCLTVQQPWASLIIAGIKLHEGRSWFTHYRGRLWIHASQKAVSQDEISSAKRTFALITSQRFPPDYPRGLLLGCVTIKDCLPQEEYKQTVKNPYMESTYVWLLEDPIPLKVKIPMNSKTNRLFKLDDHILKAAAKQLDFS